MYWLLWWIDVRKNPGAQKMQDFGPPPPAVPPAAQPPIKRPCAGFERPPPVQKGGARRDAGTPPIQLTQVPGPRGRRRRRPQSEKSPATVPIQSGFGASSLSQRRYCSAIRRTRLPPRPALTSKYVLRPRPIREACS